VSVAVITKAGVGNVPIPANGTPAPTIENPSEDLDCMSMLYAKGTNPFEFGCSIKLKVNAPNTFCVVAGIGPRDANQLRKTGGKFGIIVTGPGSASNGSRELPVGIRMDPAAAAGLIPRRVSTIVSVTAYLLPSLPDLAAKPDRLELQPFAWPNLLTLPPT
jgi:hypothetical protein